MSDVAENMSQKKTYWLLVERLENWEVDRRDGFTQFGIPSSRASLANQVEKGDLLIFYVSSGVSKFADVREAVADGTQKLSMGGQYDKAYRWKLVTRPYLTLERESWVPIQDVVHSLSLTRGIREWRQIMRSSLRRLPSEDADIILKAMRNSEKRTRK